MKKRSCQHKEQREIKKLTKKKVISPCHTLSDTAGVTALDAPCFRVPASTCVSPL